MKDALRTAGLRIPASVKGRPPAGRRGDGHGGGRAGLARGARGPVLKLDGRWSGSETDRAA